MGLNYDDIKHLSPDAQAQILKQLGAKKPQKASKMHNVVDYRGKIRFDSKKEARRYDELMLMLKAGEIEDLRLQHNFTLVEGFTRPETGERVRPIVYKADFSYYRQTDPDSYGYRHRILVVEDAKGPRTKDYKMKRKMFRDKFKFDITEV